MAHLTSFLMVMLMISCTLTNVICAPDANYWLDSILSGLNVLAPYLLSVGKDALDSYLTPRMVDFRNPMEERPPHPPGEPNQQNGQLYWLSLLPFAFAAPELSRLPELIGYPNGQGKEIAPCPCGCTVYCSCAECQCTVLSCDECPGIVEVGG